MIKHLIILMLFVSMANAQTKGKGGKNSKLKGKSTETVTILDIEDVELDPIAEFELTLPIENEIDALTGKTIFYKDRKIKNDSARAVFMKQLKIERQQFRVYTHHPVPKKPKEGESKKPKEEMKLCINIVAKDTNLLHCVNDSICRDPEVSKLMYEKSIGDTVYMLIYIEAFTKLSSYRDGVCNGGKEIKLYYVKWAAPKGKAIWKAKTVRSCYRTITNMNKEPITNWDGKSLLTVSYNKGSKFYDVKFDPDKPQAGLQYIDYSE